jgi:queuine tRNA-ribosyltransferase
VRSLDSNDLRGCDIQAIVMNVFHLMQHPGSSTITALGGLHCYSNWPYPITTDSGGFQIYSLGKRSLKSVSFTKKGIVFRQGNTSRKMLLTPEKSIRLQLSYGSDILLCLDDCTHVEESHERQKEATTRTIEWAKRCKSEFSQSVKRIKPLNRKRPLLFGIVQGGQDRELRKECADLLMEIGFDGYALGGYPLDCNGNFLRDIISLTRNLIPREFPMLALGVGNPDNIVQCLQMGYDLFDSSLPTRDARQGRLYAFESNSPHSNQFSYVYIRDKKYAKMGQPIYPECRCLTCRNYSLAYLHHLLKINDHLYTRLATIHNLTFIVSIIKSHKFVT